MIFIIFLEDGNFSRRVNSNECVYVELIDINFILKISERYLFLYLMKSFVVCLYFKFLWMVKFKDDKIIFGWWMFKGSIVFRVCLWLLVVFNVVRIND